jgi:NMD protein affecting ribosome stability and mRNA decay
MIQNQGEPWNARAKSKVVYRLTVSIGWAPHYKDDAVQLQFFKLMTRRKRAKHLKLKRMKDGALMISKVRAHIEAEFSGRDHANGHSQLSSMRTAVEMG